MGAQVALMKSLGTMAVDANGVIGRQNGFVERPKKG
jgi:hypothetical protein